MAQTYRKEWNGTLIEVREDDRGPLSGREVRRELIIDGRTVDFVEGRHIVSGQNDYMHGYDGENHIEVRFDERNFILFKGIFVEFYYNGRKIDRIPMNK